MKQMIYACTVLLLSFNLYSCGPSHVVVDTRPEPPYYVRPAVPRAGYVWVDGDWYWRGGRYVYRQGYWSRPRASRVWVTGGWHRHGNGWRWHRGHWR